MRKYLNGKMCGMAVIIVAVALMLAACNGQTANQYQTNITIDKEFTTLAEQYEVWYKAATPAVQAKWKENIDPLFRKADVALDAYQNVLLAGQDPTSQIAELRRIKTAILAELAKKYQ